MMSHYLCRRIKLYEWPLLLWFISRQTNFFEKLEGLIHNDEQTVADSGYYGTPCLTPSGIMIRIYNVSHEISRAIHEKVNERLKTFNAPYHDFRHDLKSHGYIFFAVLNVTVILLCSGNILF